MYSSNLRLVSAMLAFLSVGLLFGKAGAQQRGVSAMEMALTIVIHPDGRSSVEIVSRQQIVTITATGQKLVMPRCVAETNPTPPEWHLRSSSRSTGTQCIITLTTSHDTMRTLADQIRGFGGDLNARNNQFTLTIVRNDRFPQTPLLRYKMTYKYLVTVPVLDDVSNGIRQSVNQVAFTTTNPAHSMEIHARLRIEGAPVIPPKGDPPVLPPPSPTPTPVPAQEKRPYLGCWSEANGNVLFVGVTTLQTSRSNKALGYREVTRDAAKNLYLLRLLEIDQSKEFQSFLSMRVVGRELRTNNYLSQEDFLHGKSVGTESWIKADCADVLPQLNVPAATDTKPPPTQQPKKESKAKKAVKGIWDRIKKPN